MILHESMLYTWLNGEILMFSSVNILSKDLPLEVPLFRMLNVAMQLGELC